MGLRNGNDEQKETKGSATFTALAPTSISVEWDNLLVAGAWVVAGIYFICYIGGAL